VSPYPKYITRWEGGKETVMPPILETIGAGPAMPRYTLRC
jgi:hypothetical protein